MTTLNDRIGSATATAAETIDHNVRAAGEQLADAAGQAQQIAHQQLDKLADRIRAKPIQSTGIAAGIGFVLALLARR
jgi:ElaB/YqjD/DUF883 family membrane-anchored ribosome-binding protein